ncbi:MAG: DUF1295 domain-containing protein [Gammaproteobacteria bacterium]|nr:DUF1295 domain-containing protein [Gammaproteobacteria bacterium]
MSPEAGDGGPSWLDAWPVRAVAAATVVALACALYALFPDNAAALAKTYITPWGSYSGWRFLLSCALAYVAVTTIYHAWARLPGRTKSVRFLVVLGRLLRAPATLWHRGLAPSARVALLATLLKVYFGPMMVMWLMGAFVEALLHFAGIVVESRNGLDWLALFNHHGYWILIRTIFFVDLAIFTVGYLIESPRLGNEIRSVDPTLLGWAAALACYPPFNAVTGQMLGSQVSEFPQFEEPALHIALNLLLLALMATFAAASVALGLKASNLTHRGVVTRGPYAVVRHPAYVCKNLAWWIGSIPALSFAFDRGAWEGTLAVASIIGWTLLYALRAVTEERHLLSVDGEYAAYAARVRYRFIPGVL